MNQASRNGNRSVYLAASAAALTLLAMALMAVGLLVLLFASSSPSVEKDGGQFVNYHNSRVQNVVHWTRPRQQQQATSTLDNIFISVKTSEKFHRTRLEMVLKTWFRLAEKQVGICCQFQCQFRRLHRSTQSELIR
jgi:hypothetical protein